MCTASRDKVIIYVAFNYLLYEFSMVLLLWVGKE